MVSFVSSNLDFIVKFSELSFKCLFIKEIFSLTKLDTKVLIFSKFSSRKTFNIFFSSSVNESLYFSLNLSVAIFKNFFGLIFFLIYLSPSVSLITSFSEINQETTPSLDSCNFCKVPTFLGEVIKFCIS